MSVGWHASPHFPYSSATPRTWNCSSTAGAPSPRSFAQPQARPVSLPKTAFALLLARGASAFAPTAGRLEITRGRIGAVTATTAIAAAVIPSIDVLGAFENALIAVALGMAAWQLFVRPVPAVGWLATGFALRAALAVIEAGTYVTQLVPHDWSQAAGIRLFLAAQSSFDTGAEWVIALGCVLTLYRTIQHELTESNASLVQAQSVLQQLADRDPLTSLANRRALPAIFRRAYDVGATIVPVHGDAVAALKEADASMYRDKQRADTLRALTL